MKISVIYHSVSGNTQKQAEMTMIAAALVMGMLIYSGGVGQGYPPIHFGAVSQKAPTSDIDRERAVKLGKNIGAMAKKIF